MFPEHHAQGAISATHYPTASLSVLSPPLSCSLTPVMGHRLCCSCCNNALEPKRAPNLKQICISFIQINAYGINITSLLLNPQRNTLNVIFARKNLQRCTIILRAITCCYIESNKQLAFTHWILLGN